MYTYIPMYTYAYTRQYPMIIIQLGRGGGKKMAEGRGGWQSFSASSDKQSCKYPVGAARVERYKKRWQWWEGGRWNCCHASSPLCSLCFWLAAADSWKKRQLSASFKVTIRQHFVLCLIKSLTINFKGKVKAVFCVFFFSSKFFFFVGFFFPFFFLMQPFAIKVFSFTVWSNNKTKTNKNIYIFKKKKKKKSRAVVKAMSIVKVF